MECLNNHFMELYFMKNNSKFKAIFNYKGMFHEYGL